MGRFRIALALLLFGAGQAAAAQHVRAPLPSPLHADEWSYTDALGGVWAYRQCGYRARPAALLELNGEQQRLEAEAAAKGLGPLLERVRRRYQEILAFALLRGCGGEPHPVRAALVRARAGLAAFRAWVEAQPSVPPPGN